MCGDLKQLPPVVSRGTGPDAESTLLGRVVMNSHVPKVQLRVQHRYPSVVSKFVSEV